MAQDIYVEISSDDAAVPSGDDEQVDKQQPQDHGTEVAAEAEQDEQAVGDGQEQEQAEPEVAQVPPKLRLSELLTDVHTGPKLVCACG
jgi:hypothetical protein